MTAAEYVEVVVLPTVREFLQKPSDRRLAYLSAISTYHVVDYLMRTAGLTAREDRKAETLRIEQEIKARCGGDFYVVEGICHGTKHCGRDGAQGKRFTPGDETRSLAFGLSDGFGTFGEGHFGAPHLLVLHGSKLHVVDWAICAFIVAAVDAFSQHFVSHELTDIRIASHQPAG